ncbi:MAG: hypothetical protein HY367_03065 [Candidatus Aenigmarchaeota archaeon]|nr:hypothetical protein [Candidatus Aenigmarchaeota archaeon]
MNMLSKYLAAGSLALASLGVGCDSAARPSPKYTITSSAYGGVDSFGGEGGVLYSYRDHVREDSYQFFDDDCDGKLDVLKFEGRHFGKDIRINLSGEAIGSSPEGKGALEIFEKVKSVVKNHTYEGFRTTIKGYRTLEEDAASEGNIAPGMHGVLM